MKNFRHLKIFYSATLLLFGLLSGSCGDDGGACELEQFILNDSCTPIRWYSLPITMTLNGNLPQEVRDAAYEAEKIWENAIGFDLFKLENAQVLDENVNLIGVVQDEDWAREGGKPNQNARTVFLYLGSQMLRASILINGKILTYRDGEGRLRIDLIAVLTHELGHVAGLAHVSDRNSIMYEALALDEIKRELSPRDIQAMRALYPRDGI